MIRSGDNRIKGAAYAIAALTLFLLVLTLNTGSVKAAGCCYPENITYDWTAQDTGTKNSETVYYLGTIYSNLDDVMYGESDATRFELYVYNDDNESHDFQWELTTIVYGPNPSGNWGSNEWFSYYESGHPSEWPGELRCNDFTVAAGENNENNPTICTFAFQNEEIYDATGYFPGHIRVQFNLVNADNDEVIYTAPLIDFWVWRWELSEYTIVTTADTWTNQSAGDANYGDDNLLDIDLPSGRRNAYAKFNLSLPSMWGIQSANLEYFVEGAESLYDENLWTCGTDWIENELTFNNAGTKAIHENHITSTYPIDVGWNTQDVSDYVRAAVDEADSEIAFEFRKDGATGTKLVQIRSKEYPGNYAPRLVLELAQRVAGTAPTIVATKPTEGGEALLGGWRIILNGEIENMGDEVSMDLWFYVDDDPTVGANDYDYMYEYGNKGDVGPFSVDTVHHVYEEDTPYWFTIRGRGSYLNDSWYSNVYRFEIVENGVSGEEEEEWEENVEEEAVINTLKATEVTTTTARMWFNLGIGDESYVDVYLWLDNDDNLNSYDIISVGRYEADVDSGDEIVEDLTLNHKYNCQFVGINPAGDTIRGGWKSFTTKEEEYVEPEPDFPPITEWDDTLGEHFGIGATAGGLFLTMILFAALIFPVMYLTQRSRGQLEMIVVFVFIVLSAATALTWSPAWVIFVIAIISFMALARRQFF